MDVLPAGRFIFLEGLIGFYAILFFNFSSMLWELCNYATMAQPGEEDVFLFFSFCAVFPKFLSHEVALAML